MIYREQFVTSVKLGYVMAENALQHMPVYALFKMLCVLNVKEVYGIMVEEFSNVHFAQTTCVKTISLNTRPPVKFWNQKTSSVSTWTLENFVKLFVTN